MRLLAPLVAAAIAGCALLPAPPPPNAAPEQRLPAPLSEERLADSVPQAPAEATVPEPEPAPQPPPTAPAGPRGRIELRQDSQDRAARALTVRVRNTTCIDLWQGSGFFIAPDVLVSNRHVVEGAAVLEINTWDGRSARAAVSAVSYDTDLAVVWLQEPIPGARQAAFAEAAAGDPVVAVGYPRGGPPALAEGTVLEIADGRVFGEHAAVLRVDAEITQGYSGGPLLDDHGRVVGVIFATEVATGVGLAIAGGDLTRWLASRAFATQPIPC